MAKAKENDLSVGIQIISSENVQNYQDIKIKRRLLEDLGVIAMKMKRRRQRTKSVLWLKLPMRTTRKVVRVPPVISPGLSAGTAEVATTSDSAFHKRFSSSYDSSPSSTLPVWKRYRGTSKLILGTDSDEDEEDEGLATGVEGPGLDDESYGLDDKSYGLDYESYGLDNESYGLDDESRGIDDESPRIESDGLGLEEEEAVPEGQQRAVPVVGTVVNEPLGLGYGALRR
uniref:Uncharacterized protein n=1 Tax=Tanacetum cinerariifolium TaxID=118510 RepID=A0A6L2NLF8_TANCI|nr:hypothetical protein [Tanacetum cinerariifolium]